MCRKAPTSIPYRDRAKADSPWPRNRTRIPKNRRQIVRSVAVAPRDGAARPNRKFVGQPTPMRQGDRAISNGWPKAGAKPPTGDDSTAACHRAIDIPCRVAACARQPKTATTQHRLVEPADATWVRPCGTLTHAQTDRLVLA